METKYDSWGEDEMMEEIESRGYELDVDSSWGDRELVEILIETEK